MQPPMVIAECRTTPAGHVWLTGVVIMCGACQWISTGVPSTGTRARS